MGGDCIGSDLVYISRGIDYVAACVDIACGRAPDLRVRQSSRIAAIRFIFCQEDMNDLDFIRRNYPESIYHVSEILPMDGREISDSSTRYGFYILSAETMEKMTEILSHVDFDLN